MNQININRLKFIYDGLESSFIVVFVLSTIIFFSLLNVVEFEKVSLWYGVTNLILFIRWYIFRDYKKSGLNEENFKWHYNTYFYFSILFAATWGFGLYLIIPEQIEYQILIIMIIAGLASGFSVSNAEYTKFVYTYIALLFIPLIAYFLGSDNVVNYSIVGSTLLYYIFLNILTKKISTTVIENITFKIENESLIQQLKDEANKANSANKAKSHFLSVVSHEIRTPLNAIIGFIKVLIKMESDEKKLKYLHTVDKSSFLLLNIINDILDLSKIESGKLELESLEFDIEEEVRVLYELFAEVSKEKNINLVLNYDEKIPKKLISDKVRFKQIVANLLSNAVKFTPEGKSVALNISFDKKSHELQVEVKDEGIGISKEDIGKIVQDFVQVDSSTSRVYGGTGLGLSIVKKLLRLFGSELHIESEVGKGSSFSFSLFVELVQESSVVDEPEEIEETFDFEGKKVLVAEDNKTNQMLIRLLLEDMNIDVTIAEDGVEVEKLYFEGSYDLILMDINMPNKNGIEAMQDIKAKDSIIDIVALTANSVSGDKERFLAEGFDAYLAKPIDNDELALILQKSLNMHQ